MEVGAMDVEIKTDHVAMCPEWDQMIHTWVERCTKHHPSVAGMDVVLRYGGRRAPGEVEAVATTRGRKLRAATHSRLISVALHDALEALEQELLVHEAVSRAA
jgi:ribosome-associated translation inhibitor RaiA